MQIDVRIINNQNHTIEHMNGNLQFTYTIQ